MATYNEMGNLINHYISMSWGGLLQHLSCCSFLLLIVSDGSEKLAYVLIYTQNWVGCRDSPWLYDSADKLHRFGKMCSEV